MSDRNELSLMDGEVKERQEYCEERIRAEQRRGRSRNAPAEGAFPETPDLLPDGNVERRSEWENAAFSEGEGFQTGLVPGNVAQDEALQEVEDEIAALRQKGRGNVPPACVCNTDRNHPPAPACEGHAVTFPALINFPWVEFGKRFGKRWETPLKRFAISGYDKRKPPMQRAKK
jgi:hypothetical protein